MRTSGEHRASRRPAALLRSTLIATIGCAIAGGLGGAAAPVPAEKRIALLIQNDIYRGSETGPPVDKDASTLADLLKRDGFEVDLVTNIGRDKMRASVDAFVARVTPKTIALVYFKGIGIQAAQLTHMIPVDAAIWSEDDVRREGVGLNRLMADLDRHGARIKIAIIDAARPNPFERRFRGASAGLAPPVSPEGSLVIFADALNKTSEPTTEPVSPFMTELVRQLKDANDVEEAFARTREGVSKQSKGRELPWVSSTLGAAFALTPAPATPSPGETSMSQTTMAQTKPAKPPPGARVGDAFRDCPDCPEMIVLAAGSFQMGSGATPFDRPVHKVTIAKPFAIGQTVVTRDEWARCLEDKGCRFHPDGKDIAGPYPVIAVNWFDAKEYADWLSRKTGQVYRLPTEAEWEYAARGGTTTAFSWGDAVGQGHANCNDCGVEGSPAPKPVKTYPKNGFGLYDTAGNVAQWLQDCWALTYRGAPADGTATSAASCETRVVRGGSFDTSAAFIKPTARSRADAEARAPGIGFRVARDVR